MENATKALIIAGGMLLAMLIVGLLVWGYTNLSSYRNTQVEAEALEQITEFNSVFEAYNRRSVRGYQMISLANLARDYNTRYREEDGYTPVEIIMKMDTGSHLPTSTETTQQPKMVYGDYYDMIQYVEVIYEAMKKEGNSNNRNMFKEMYFECTAVIYDNEYDSRTGSNPNGLGRVRRMEFEQVQPINR